MSVTFRIGAIALAALIAGAGAAMGEPKAKSGTAAARGGHARPAMGAAPRPSFGGAARPAFAGRPPAGRPAFAPAVRAPASAARPSFARPSFAQRPFARPTFQGRAARAFARPSLRAGLARSSVRPSLRAGVARSFARPFYRTRGAAAIARGSRIASPGTWPSRASTRAAAIRAQAGLASGRPAWAGRWAGRGTGVGAGAIGSAFAAHRIAHADWYRHWRRHRIVFGWVGPVFWPYAYHDVFASVFWPHLYPYDPFWVYGYPDIYAGIFSPYGYEQFFAYAPGAGRRRVASAPARGVSDARGPTAGVTSRYAPYCGDDSREVAGVPVEDIQNAVAPDDAQRAALDALANAAIKAAQIIKAACPSDVSLTPTGRLDAMQRRIEAMIEATRIVRPPLDKFYDMLGDEQKARFNAIGQDRRDGARSLVRDCGGGGVAEWPTTQIERTVRPTAAQRDRLDALQNAAAQAADRLRATCLTEMPVTPSARLAAIEERLVAMLEAIQSVRGALAEFYGALSDEQKAQFNAIGRAHTRR